jgi:hypothetical protein
VEYRRFGKVGFKPSALGFGAMRLPRLPASDTSPRAAPRALGGVDRDAATTMLRYAVEHGVNYVDTAYDYHGGESEVWLGGALREVAAALHGSGEAGWAAFRRRVKVATKQPAWKCHERADLERFLGEQLERLRLPTVDFYLLHSLNADSWAQVRDLGVLASELGSLPAGTVYFTADAIEGVPLLDAVLQRGGRPWGMATDDYHEGWPGTAWIVARLPSLTVDALLAALTAGQFYASTGATISDVQLAGTGVTVHTSPCVTISCISSAGTQTATGSATSPIQEATFALTGSERWLRIQVEDSEGGRAFSNPLVPPPADT